MKVKLDLHGVIFEYEKQPIPERRFKALCALAAAALYVFLTVCSTRLCGLAGLAVIAVATVIVLAAESI